jgi:hypothetical protein
MSDTPRSSTDTLIRAVRILAHGIQTDDGVANAALFEAADRLEELKKQNDEMLELLHDVRWEVEASGLRALDILSPEVITDIRLFTKLLWGKK